MTPNERADMLQQAVFDALHCLTYRPEAPDTDCAIQYLELAYSRATAQESESTTTANERTDDPICPNCNRYQSLHIVAEVNSQHSVGFLKILICPTSVYPMTNERTE